MPTSERRALVLLLALAVAGQGVRYLLTKPGEAPGGVQLISTLGSESPLAQRDSSMQQARPLAVGEQIDVDRASAGELARLPKVGLRLAKTIVADRQANGPFGRLDGLDRVPGVGPGLLKAVGPHVVFSGEPGVQGNGSGPALLDINNATLTDLDALPGIGPAKAQAVIGYREEHGRFTSVEDLAEVPGLNRAVLARLRQRLVVR